MTRRITPGADFAPAEPLRRFAPHLDRMEERLPPTSSPSLQVIDGKLTVSTDDLQRIAASGMVPTSSSPAEIFGPNVEAPLVFTPTALIARPAGAARMPEAAIVPPQGFLAAAHAARASREVL